MVIIEEEQKITDQEKYVENLKKNWSEFDRIVDELFEKDGYNGEYYAGLREHVSHLAQVLELKRSESDEEILRVAMRLSVEIRKESDVLLALAELLGEQ